MIRIQSISDKASPIKQDHLAGHQALNRIPVVGEFGMAVRTLRICTRTELPSAGAFRQSGRDTVKQFSRGL
ncbi:protein of unknown function [Burkholderia multivorans]